MKFAQRTQTRGRLWNAALISLSTASALVSVAFLSDANVYGAHGEYLWCAIGIMTLAASLVIANASYGEKSTLLFEAYRQFQRISVEAEFASRVTRNSRTRHRTFQRLNAEYQQLLDRTPNHSQADYARAMTWRIERPGISRDSRPAVRYVRRRELAKWRLLIIVDLLVTAIPAVLLVSSIALLVPTIIWVFRG